MRAEQLQNFSNVGNGTKKRLLSYKLASTIFWRDPELTQCTRDEVHFSSEVEWMHKAGTQLELAATSSGGMGTDVTTMCHHIFVPLNRPFRDQNFLLPGISLPTCRTFYKKEGHSAEMQKMKYNSVEVQNALPAYSNAGGIVNWYPLKFCCHTKKHQRSNDIVERGPLFASCRTKTISAKIV